LASVEKKNRENTTNILLDILPLEYFKKNFLKMQKNRSICYYKTTAKMHQNAGNEAIFVNFSWLWSGHHTTRPKGRSLLT
jgi:hypothetical protein